MTVRKLAIMALGLTAVCVQCDPIVRAEADSLKQETSIQSFADYDLEGPELTLAANMVRTAMKVSERKNELAAEAKAEQEKEERIAVRKAQVSKRVEVRAKAMAEARAKEQAEKEAAEREIAKDATGSYYNGIRLMSTEPYETGKGHLTRSNGTVRYNGHRETWYSTNEGAGQATAVHIPGKHVAKDGTIRDAEGYICVAAAQSYMRVYSTLMTSLGPAKVYDTGCSHGTIDVYTCW